MGKATILSAQGEGAYTATVNMERTRIEDELAAIASDLEALAPEIEEAQEVYDFAELEFEESVMLLRELIDAYAAGFDVDDISDCTVDPSGLVAAHNARRAAAGVGSLTTDSSLMNAAQGHATWLAQNNQTGHTGSGGSTAQQRLYAAGFDGTIYGENVAAGLESVDAAMDGWMASSGHRANLLNPAFVRMGYGYNCREDGPFRHFWVVVLGD